MSGATFSAGDILRTAAAIARRRLALIAATYLVLAGGGFAVDGGFLSQAAQTPANFILTIATLVLSYVLMRRALDDLGGSTPGHGGGGAFVLVGIVWTAGVGLALLLLVVPGIVLLVRWSAATPILLDEPVGVIESLQESWARTAGHAVPIAVSLVAAWGPVVASIVAATLLELQFSSTSAALLISLALPLSQIAGWYVALAIHQLTRSNRALAEVFA